MNEKILLFIPMYNCEKQISRVLGKLDPEVQKLFAEVLVVDNRSADKSVESAREALAKLDHTKTTLLQNNANYSLGGSIKVAFNYALEHRFDSLVVLHGDDQGDIRDIVPVLQSGKHHEADITVGARFHSKSTLVGYSRLRTVGNKVFNIFYTLVTGKKIDDMIAGLNIFKVSFLEKKFYLAFPNNLTFDAHLLLYAIHFRKKIQFVPITWREEDQISNAKVFRQGRIILKLLMRYLFIKERIFKRMENNDWANMSYTSTSLFCREGSFR